MSSSSLQSAITNSLRDVGWKETQRCKSNRRRSKDRQFGKLFRSPASAALGHVKFSLMPSQVPFNTSPDTNSAAKSPIEYAYAPVIAEPRSVGAVYYKDTHPFTGTEALPDGHPAKKINRRSAANNAAESEYNALRIVPEPISQEALTAAQAAFINDDLMPAAIAFFADTLKVFPVSGSLAKDYTCTLAWHHTNPSQCAMDASSNGATCGNLVNVPSAHLSGKDQFGRNSHCTDPSSASYSGCTTYPNQGGGVHNADFVIYVTAQSVSPCPSSLGSGTLAWSRQCQADQYDRPTMGYVNFW